MEELIELLEEIQPDADFENCDTLIDDGILDSFAIQMCIRDRISTADWQSLAYYFTQFSYMQIFPVVWMW